jgi:hypothetical protein
MSFTLNYETMLALDAEELAETGIKRAYDSMMDEFRHYVPDPAEVQEVVDSDAPSYSVKCCGVEHPMYSPDLADEWSWGRAAYAFFKIVNDQLATSEYRLYAINGGNDLGGMFLTASECEAARRSLTRPEDWPYLPTLEDPWHGQFHR